MAKAPKKERSIPSIVFADNDLLLLEAVGDFLRENGFRASWRETGSKRSSCVAGRNRIVSFSTSSCRNWMGRGCVGSSGRTRPSEYGGYRLLRDKPRDYSSFPR
jgi:hypothetical protein